MKARNTLAALLVLVQVQLLSSCGPLLGATTETSEDTGSKGDGYVLEENTAPVVLRFDSRGGERSGFELFVGTVFIRMIPWRQTMPDERIVKVRLSMVRDVFGMQEELTFFQLASSELDSLIAFCRRFQDVELKKPGEVVDYRQLTGNWGDFQLRRDPLGIYGSTPQMGTWFPLDVEHLIEGIERAKEALATLRKTTPSVKF
jgi:hypothetical protein